MVAAGTLLAVALLAAGCGDDGSPAQQAPSDQKSALEATAGETGSVAEDRIIVSGTGRVLSRPDQAVLTIAVETEDPQAAAAMDKNSKQMQSVIERLKAEGLPDAAIETTGVSVYPVQEAPPPGSDKPVVKGYRAQNTLRVTITQLDTVGKIYAAAVEAGANNVQGPEWRLSENSEPVKQALAKAVEAARGKAEALATAAQASVGAVRSLREDSGSVPFYARDMMLTTASGEVAQPPIQEQQLEVQATVTVVYELKR